LKLLQEMISLESVGFSPFLQLCLYGQFLSGIQEVVQWLAKQPAIIWVAPAPTVRTHNFYATAITQSGTTTAVDLSSNAPYGGAAATHYVWEAGLQVRYTTAANAKVATDVMLRCCQMCCNALFNVFHRTACSTESSNHYWLWTLRPRRGLFLLHQRLKPSLLCICS
jgi:hypothetical protein